ncbi:MAG: tetratricopeptide repeat protein [Phycisphaerae bacterium]|nr:tetratricopeptide repeat protein [Phycisphaerae bacterium]
MTTDAPAIEPDESPGRWTWARLSLIGLTLVVLAPICGHDFLWWDDHGTIHQNPWLNPPTIASLFHYWKTPQYGLYIPVTGSVWTAIAAIARVQPDRFDISLNPWFFHAASVIAHLIATLLMFRIFRLLNATAWAAFFGATVFAIHPLQIESVAWASGLKDVLAGMFAAAAALQYIRFALAKQSGDKWIGRLIAATIFFELAMLSKASATMLPLAVIALDRWAVGRRWREIIPAGIAWIVLAVPIAVYASIVQDPGNTPITPLPLRPLIACDALAFYLFKLVWPLNLGVDYGRTARVVIEHGWLWWDWIVPVGVAVILWLGRARRPILLAAAGIFVAGLFPTLGWTPTLYQFYTTTADHYVYFAMFGVGLAVAWLLSVYPQRWLWSLAVIIVVVMSILSLIQQSYWRNDYALFEHSVQVNPNSYISFGNLGSAYARDGRYPEALGIFCRAVQINPDYSLSFSNLGHVLAEMDDIDGALAADQKSIELQEKHSTMRPSWVRDNQQAAELLMKRGQYANAERYLQNGIEFDSQNETLLGLLSECQRRGRLSDHTSTTSTTLTVPSSDPSR